MKRVIAILTALTLILASSACIFGAENGEKSVMTNGNECSFSGFSYEIHGKQVDKTDDYNATMIYQVLDDDKIKVEISASAGIIKENLSMILLKSSENLYVGTLENGTTVNLEFLTNGQPILDIVKGDRVYAFGGDRRLAIESYITQLDREIARQGEPTIQPMYSGGTMKTASNSKVYMRAVWNPSKSNRLAIRVNTQGSQVGATVQSIQIKNGKVSSAYVVKSLNPTGANSSSNFVKTLSYILDSVTYYVKLPSFTDKPVSSCSGNSFSFNVTGMGANWNDMNSTSNSTAGVNGMMFYVFLDDNLSTKPNPTGTINIRYRIVATGSFDASLTF